MLDSEIKVKKGGSHHGDSFEYSHESFGMARISHIQGRCKTFGSELESSSLVELTISNCEVTQSLGTNWYHDTDDIVQVRMSAVQYAELISNPNSQGTPCTITHSEKHGRILEKHIDTKTQYVESKIEKTVNELHKNVATLQKDMNAILDRKGTFKKSDREDIKKLFHNSLLKINNNLPFYEKCMKENIEELKSEARADINCHIQHAINETGLAALKDPEIVKQLLNINNNDTQLSIEEK